MFGSDQGREKGNEKNGERGWMGEGKLIGKGEGRRPIFGNGKE